MHNYVFLVHVGSLQQLYTYRKLFTFTSLELAVKVKTVVTSVYSLSNETSTQFPVVNVGASVQNLLPMLRPVAGLALDAQTGACTSWPRSAQSRQW